MILSVIREIYDRIDKKGYIFNLLKNSAVNHDKVAAVRLSLVRWAMEW